MLPCSVFLPPLLSVSWRALRPKTPSHRALYNNISPLASHSLSQRFNTWANIRERGCASTGSPIQGCGRGRTVPAVHQSGPGSVSAAGSLYANPRSAGIPQLCIRVCQPQLCQLWNGSTPVSYCVGKRKAANPMWSILRCFQYTEIHSKCRPWLVAGLWPVQEDEFCSSCYQLNV